MNIFGQRKLKQQLEQLRDKLISTECAVQEVANERDLLKGQVVEFQRERSDNKYKWLYFLPSGQGELFKRLLESHREGKPVKLENLCCPGMYLADRHSSVYELVNRILIEDLKIANSHFEYACFDNVTFRNVIFDNVCFYKAFFEDVRFEKCTFNRCDFNEVRRDNLVFEDCMESDTDLMRVKALEVPNQGSESEELNEDSEKATEDKTKFWGYCFETIGGKYYPPVTLFGPEEVYNYVNLQKRFFDEVRITDEDDYLVVHALKGKIIFPEEWVGLSK